MSEQKSRVTLWGIEVFVVTADDGSISQAARRLGISAGTVSQRLSNLEAAIGAVLLDRSTRPVTLTPAGRMFRNRAQVILNEAALAKAEVGMPDFSALTQFRLGMIEDFDSVVSPELLRRMAGELQSCQFFMETGPSHRLFDLLDNRTLDVVVAADLGASADWVEVQPIVQDPFVAVAPKGVDIKREFTEIPFIQYTQRHVMGRQIEGHLAHQDLRLAHQFELDSYHAIMALVAAGQGWTITTPLGWMHAERFRGETQMHPLPFAPLERVISLNARADVLGDIPRQTAQHLRDILGDLIIAPLVQDCPWIADRFVLA